ncbi:sigma-54-dependent transcriptional regulator [Marinospirillum insulare]|uniref:C4-dicarboxylate transport transcriptional regulatory protein DctD n=1 Tax=Marinospirillum insulare TaxID=217169 RepID=A0ABQ5ZZ90_9GAMM|nr:sigma-54 dependent transcriptional regulator [Marinospirillum insulare]GLR63652.1 C4-dicarboxylate transport transcriptional regulatory protein DctD [Marinospirillum insulare]
MIQISPDTQLVLLDDDSHLRTALSQTFDLAGLKVQAFANAEGVLAALPTDWLGVLVTDIRMPGISGLELLEQAQQLDKQLPVLLITGQGDVPLAVQAMRQGAYDFLQKPFANDLLLDSVHRALEVRRLVIENRALRSALAEQKLLGERLLGHSASAERLREQVRALANIQADVLILGETGSGKEVVARALHDLSSRSNAPFVAINTGALAESVIESELFGHEAGAFTGANKRRIGKFEHANGGTVFLDEIESMSLDVQVKLLRLLQERVVERVGSNQLIPLDIRIVAATKEDLLIAADEGRFRADLFYRLNVAQINLPPLRQRPEDILPLFQHFATQASQRYKTEELNLDSATRAQLLSHDWPGNIRELQNAAERWVLGLDLAISQLTANPTTQVSNQPLAQQVENFERNLLMAELSKQHSSLREVAEALQLPRKTLHDKLRKHGLSTKLTGENPPTLG